MDALATIQFFTGNMYRSQTLAGSIHLRANLYLIAERGGAAALNKELASLKAWILESDEIENG